MSAPVRALPADANGRATPRSALSRELRWALITLAQIPVLCALTFVASLFPNEWLGRIFAIPGETVLIPFFIGAVLVIPVAVAVLLVLGLGLARARTGRRVWVTVLEHVVAAFVGTLVFVEGVVWFQTGAPSHSPKILLSAYPVFNLVLVVIYWPRLAFRSLRTPIPAPPR